MTVFAHLVPKRGELPPVDATGRSDMPPKNVCPSTLIDRLGGEPIELRHPYNSTVECVAVPALTHLLLWEREMWEAAGCPRFYPRWGRQLDRRFVVELSESPSYSSGENLVLQYSLWHFLLHLLGWYGTLDQCHLRWQPVEVPAPSSISREFHGRTMLDVTRVLGIYDVAESGWVHWVNHCIAPLEFWRSIPLLPVEIDQRLPNISPLNFWRKEGVLDILTGSDGCEYVILNSQIHLETPYVTAEPLYPAIPAGCYDLYFRFQRVVAQANRFTVSWSKEDDALASAGIPRVSALADWMWVFLRLFMLDARPSSEEPPRSYVKVPGDREVLVEWHPYSHYIDGRAKNVNPAVENLLKSYINGRLLNPARIGLPVGGPWAGQLPSSQRLAESYQANTGRGRRPRRSGSRQAPPDRP